MREALIEREVLWRIAPHIIWPLRFVLPHHAGCGRPGCCGSGLFLYDHLGGRKLLPPTRTRAICGSDRAGQPLKPEFTPRLRIFRLLGRRCAPRGAQRARRRRIAAPTIAHPHPLRHPPSARPASGTLTLRRRRDAASARRSRRARWSTPPAPGSARCWPSVLRVNAARQGAAGPGQPHRGAASSTITTALLHLPERRRPHLLRHSLSRTISR